MSAQTAWLQLLALLSPQVDATPSLSEAEWSGVLALAERHEVAPLLYHRCIREKNAAVPPGVYQALRHAYLRTAYANTRTYEALGTLLQATQAAGVPVIVLKGACLAELVYPDIAMRSMADIDLLVHSEALPVVCDLSAALGYKFYHGAAVMVPGGNSFSRHVSQLIADNGPALEWHWTLSYRSDDTEEHQTAELATLWEHARPVTIAGQAAYMLAPEYLLLHLCLHLSNHHHLYVGCLKGCLDLYFVLDKYGAELDWEFIRARAEAWRVWHGVALALHLAHRWAGATLPEHVHRWIAEATPAPALLSWAESRMYETDSPDRLNLTILDKRREAVATRSGAVGKLRGAVCTLFPPREVMALQYPAPARSWRIFLYYPLRFIDCWRRYNRTLLRLLSADAQTNQAFRKATALRRWLDEQ